MAENNLQDCVARAKIAEHEKRNNDRFETLTSALDRVEEMIGGLYRNQWRFAFYAITLLLTILLTLLGYIWQGHAG